MTSPVFTERRLYRPAAILQGFQTVAGTPVADFSTAATRAMWARQFEFDPGIVKDDPQGTTGSGKKRQEARFLKHRLPVGRFVGGATPKNIEWILRNWGGTWAGGPLAFTFTEAQPEFATFALVEKTPLPNTQKLVRVWDGWFWRVAFVQSSGLTTLDIDADFAARDFDRTPLNALGGITLPVSFAPPAIDVFAPHQARLYRDPAGANVSIAIRELRLEFKGGLLHEPWNDVAPQVINEGYNSVKLHLRSVWEDENYAIETDVETATPTFKRFSAEWTSGAKSFKVDMKNVDFTASPTGWTDGRFREFIVDGEAYFDGGSNYIDITLAT